MTIIKNVQEVVNIIEALSRHSDSSSIAVLEEIGTNCDDDLVRELTTKALINRNTHDSLKIVLINKGKGIHDLNAMIVESAINSLRSLNDKAEAIRILDDTINLHSDEMVKQRAIMVRDSISNSN